MDYITIKGAVRKWDWCKAFAPRWGRKTATGVDMFILEWHWRFSDSSDKESDGQACPFDSCTAMLISMLIRLGMKQRSVKHCM